MSPLKKLSLGRTCFWSSAPLAAALLTCMASTAYAEPERETAPRATDQHRTMVSGGVGGTWSNDDSRVPWPSFRRWYAYAAPELSYFVRDGIGIGLSLGGMYGYERSQGYMLDLDLRDIQLFAGLSAILELPLGTRTSLLAIPKLSYVHSSRRVASMRFKSNVNAPGRNIQSQTALAWARDSVEYDTHAVRASLLLPLVVHASDAVLIGVGPEIWLDRALGEPQQEGLDTLLSIGVSTWLGLSL